MCRLVEAVSYNPGSHRHCHVPRPHDCSSSLRCRPHLTPGSFSLQRSSPTHQGHCLEPGWLKLAIMLSSAQVQGQSAFRSGGKKICLATATTCCTCSSERCGPIGKLSSSPESSAMPLHPAIHVEPSLYAPALPGLIG